MENSQTHALRVTAILMPSYYSEFQCLAGKCQNTCCHNWNITLSKKDYMTLRRSITSDELKRRFQGSVRRRRENPGSDAFYADFRLLENGACPFWNEDGLCALQLECGHQVLPNICRIFPRKDTAVASGRLERSCSLACEAVYPLLYSRQGGLNFILEDISPQEQPIAHFDSWRPLLGYHHPIQELCIDILQTRAHPLSRRMLMLGWLLQDLDRRDKDAPDRGWDVPGWLAQGRAITANEAFWAEIGRMEGNQLMFVLNNVKQLLMLQLIPSPIKTEIFNFLELTGNPNDQKFTLHLEGYQQAEQEFVQSYGDLEYFFENIFVNIIFHNKYPLLAGESDIWENYSEFCTIYSMFRFLTICYCHGHTSLDRLFGILTVAARGLLHSSSTRKILTADYVSHGNTTLADMAVLVCG